jgi:serine/threonine protein phosphatase PrpC
LSAPPIQLHVAGRTDVGLVREHNEDNFVVVDLERKTRETVDGMRTIDVGERGALLVVCDGMGGAAAGEVASSMAVDALYDTMTGLNPPQAAKADNGVPAEELRVANFARRLRSAAYTANQLIFDASRSDNARAGMGTTMTGVGVLDDRLVMTQVGDSRAYVLRGTTITQVTRDQSLVNQLIETGQITEEQARLFEHSNVILQALGVQQDVEVLLSTVKLCRGDRVVVCSDGLTGVVTDDELSAVLGACEDTAEACRLLIEMARAAGGPDNITCVVARFEGEALQPPTENDKVVYERWRLDEPDPATVPVDPHEPITGSMPAVPAVQPAAAPAPARAGQPMKQAEIFFSSMLLLALALGSVIVASLIFRNAPSGECLISGGAPGLSIRLDGRDTGARTVEGTTEVRLPLGQHRIGLRGQGAPAYERTVDVASGDATPVCTAKFEPGPP